jgi:serine/threonine-protein kinase
VETAVRYAAQIAEALEAAHERGIVHRDLKPGNVRITPDGAVKVLDFGLATSASGAAESGSSQAPTVTAGIILGTAAYMAPEQARGQAVDRRADIWAFGAVLYEMLAGRRAFGGESIADVLGAVMEREPDWSALPRETPAHVLRLLRRCLTKERKERLQAIGEARIALGQRDGETGEAPRRASRLAWAVAAIAAVVAVVAGVAAWRGTREAESAVARVTGQPGPEFDPVGTGPSAILSPDGSRLVYTGRGSDGRQRLYTRAMAQETAMALPGTEGAREPFFSPDGESVAYFAAGKLRKVFVRGEGGVVLCDAALPTGGSWGDNGEIVLAPSSSGVLWKVSSGGGAPQAVTQLRGKELTHRWPQVLPGSEAMLFTAHTAGLGFDDATIEAQSLRTGERKTLVRGGTYGRYVASGHLLYVRQGVLFAAAMDPRKLELTGAATPVAEGVTYSTYGGAQFDVARNGTLVLRKGGEQKGALLWLDRSGKGSPALPGAREYPSTMEFSPDGKRLAMVVSEGGNADVWVYEWERDVMTRLTFTPGLDGFPKWTPDGKHLLFSSVRHGGAQNLYWMRSDGAGEAVRLTDSATVQVPASVSTDGKRITYTEIHPLNGYDIYTAAIEGADGDRPKLGPAEPFAVTPLNEAGNGISSDGRWLLYTSNETGDTEVFVQPFPGPGGKVRISTAGGLTPVWSRRSGRIFYLTAEGIMAVDATSQGETFQAGRPSLWAAHKGIRTFAMTPDEQRAAITAADPSSAAQTPRVLFVFGFFEELRRHATGR